MARTAIIDHRTLGASVLERLAEADAPKALAAPGEPGNPA